MTLIFSRRRYAEVINAFLDGIEHARAAGRDLTRLASVASFFVSRVDTEIDQRLDAIGSVEAKALRGAAAIANARLAFQSYDEVFTADRWQTLTRAGARPQRPLWASTGVKDPAYPDTRYVVDLVTGGVVNTMPEATLRAMADHGALRGDLHAREFIAFWLRDQRVVAAMNVNIWDVIEPIEQLIRSGERVDATTLADPGVPLGELVTT